MKLQLSPAWYKREIEREEHLHVTAGRSSLDPLLEETRMHGAVLSPREETMTGLAQKIGEVVNKAEEAYAQSTPLRTTILGFGGATALIHPVAGPIIAGLDVLLGTRGQNITARRLQRTIDEILKQAQQLNDSKLDKSFLESEEFFDLSWNVFEQGQRTADNQKAALYVRVLLQSTQAPPYRENAQEYLALLAGLSPTEIQIAAVMYDYGEADAFDVARVLPDMDSDIAAGYLHRLVRTGLILDSIRYDPGNVEVTLGIGEVKRGEFVVTDYFHRMMAYLELNDLTEYLQKKSTDSRSAAQVNTR